MKKNIVLYLSFLALHISLSACPTCVGTIKPEKPAFFSAEFYQPNDSASRESKEQFGHKEFKKLIEAKRGKK